MLSISCPLWSTVVKHLKTIAFRQLNWQIVMEHRFVRLLCTLFRMRCWCRMWVASVTKLTITHYDRSDNTPGPHRQIKEHICRYSHGIVIIMIRRTLDRLIFIMGIPILVRRCLYIFTSQITLNLTRVLCISIFHRRYPPYLRFCIYMYDAD